MNNRLLTEEEFTDAIFECAKLNIPDVEKYFGDKKEEWLKLYTPQEFLTPIMKFRLKKQDAKTAEIVRADTLKEVGEWLESRLFKYFADFCPGTQKVEEYMDLVILKKEVEALKKGEKPE